VFGIWRRGDVLVIATEEPVPADAELLPRANGRVVLAHREVTGDAHAALDWTVELSAGAEDRFLAAVGGAAALVPAQHGTVTVPSGTCRVWRQPKYAPQAPVQMAG